MTRREHATYLIACVLLLLDTAEIFWQIGAVLARRVAGL